MSEQTRPERGLFMWYDDEGHRAWGVVFPNGDVFVLWDRHSWPTVEQLAGDHVSIYGGVGDLMQAAGGRLEWGSWDAE